jgi:3-oxoacyl-(acyl-carrier-protein) synthase
VREPLAITGMSAVFPGADDLDALWSRIVSAQPADVTSLEARWGVARARYLGRAGEADRAYTDVAFCVSDAAFSDDDLRDRQVRLGRTVATRALDDARRAGAELDPKRVGLALATSWTGPSYFDEDARLTVLGRDARARAEHAFSPDRQLDAIAQGLGGPRLAIDTACASSLYALDVASGLIDADAADAVIVLGLNALLTPFLYLGFAKLMALAPDGRILPFSRDASGIVPGEGAGAIVVEPLSRVRARGAVANGIVRGIGLAADGAERSIFAPGARGQALAYERAYDGIDPRDVDYVEAHGTATAVGDETELTTLDAFFGARRCESERLAIGSIKALVGHTLAAAGVASILKVLLMMRARTLPPHVAIEPHARLASTRLALDAAPHAWPSSGRVMRAGVSSFGFGGSNAHVVIESDDGAPRASIAPKPMSEPLAIVDAASMLPLPSTASIEAAGLRMGPNLLKRVDPLQLVVTHLVHEIVARNTHLHGSTTAGVVVTKNLGGAMSLRLSRKYAARFADAPAPNDAPDLTVEAIASSLPSMCSGYPAYHFDIRGFHATLAGGTPTFFESLRLASHWLDGACDALVIAAARTNDGPLDARDGARAGVAAFLVEPLSRAQSRGARVLATMRVATAASDVAHTEATLGEATGVDAMLAALRTCGTRAVNHGGVEVAIETIAPLEPSARSITRPLEVTLRAPEPKPREHHSDRDTGLVRFVSHATAGVLAFFASQRAALALVDRPRAIARRDENVVIANASSGGATLVVDESHPYFFDHPLDHVPGILLAEGALQLVERAAQDDATYVRALGLRFRRFCEKKGPIAITLGGDLRGRFEQRGEIVATFDMELARAHAREVSAREARTPTVDASLLHKSRAENVLVAPLERTADGYVATLLAPPRGHFFEDGHAAFHSPLYVLECARQTVMLGAHSVLGIPLGLPMTLLSVRVSLDAPVPRGAALRMRLHETAPKRAWGALLADARVTLLSDRGALGEVRVRAQVQDRAAYEAQRGAVS